MISHSWRSWKNAKSLALLAILALATGIGCATAIFTVVNGVMLRPLPYSRAERWVALFGGSTLASEADRYSGLSISDLTDYQQRTHSFDAFGWYKILGDFNLTARGLVEHLNGAEVTPSLLNGIGVQPVVGRLFQDSDGAQVAMISSRLWRQLGSDPAITGKTIALNGQVYAIAGVMPAWFQLPIVSVAVNSDTNNDVWIPITPPSSEEMRHFVYAGYARMKPGVTIVQAREDTKRVAAEIVKEDAGRSPTYTATMFGLRDFVVQEIRPYLLLAFAAAGLLLLVTCANVAGLLVARSVSRAHEIAIRMTLGARRGHLALQFFLEGCLISIAAAGLGLLASIGLTRAIVSMAAQYIPRAAEIKTDGMVVLFVAGLACLTAMLPALAPLWQAVRTQPNEILSNGVRASAGARSRMLSKSLVIAEIAFAFLLLALSGLLISELERLRHTSPGFEAGHLLTFQLNESDEEYATTKDYLAHQDQLLGSLQALPGVSGAAFVNQLPLDGCCFTTGLHAEGQPANPDFEESVSYVVISPSYFQTMRIPLEAGRLLNAGDTNENLTPVVIDEAAARRFWPNGNQVGAFARLGSGPEAGRVQVVGVVGDVRNEGLGEATRPEVYLLNAVAPIAQMQFVVRSDLPTASLLPAIRLALKSVEPNRAMYAVQTMDRIAADSVAPQRLDSAGIAFFALAAFLLAALGIYGVMSYSVRERTVEIGTRMALGAQRGDLLKLVVGDGLKMAAIGIVIGIPAAAAATWLVTRFLNVQHISALPNAFSAALVGSVAMMASLFPAWRATLVSPMVAIRNEMESLWSAGLRSVGEALRADASKTSTTLLDPALLNGFIDASRRADSYSEVLGIALADLREGLGSESAMLFENASTPGGPYHYRAASPGRAATGTIAADGFLLGRLKFRTSPLVLTDDELETVLRWAREEEPRYVAEIQNLKQIGARLAAPLRTKDGIMGLLLLGPSVDRKNYGTAEKELMQVCAQQLALMIENARLTDRVVEQEKIRRDVALAAEVQERLLPEKWIEVGPASAAAFTLPARGVGGDCYDFLELGNQEIAIALADVAGKGISAALIMAAIQASLRILATEGRMSPAILAAKMNDFLYRSTGFDRYATFFYAQLDAGKRQLRYVNAGHNPPFLARASAFNAGKENAYAIIEELKSGGTVIGMFPSSEYEEATVELRAGDAMLAFTDGVTEALNPNQEEFGEERLKTLFRSVAHLPVKEIVSSIADELRSWIADAPQHDDLTFIVAKMN